jgi:hydrogenase maturation factor
MEIKVLGPGCPKCQQTEKVVKEAVAEAGVDAQIEKITDTMEIAGYGNPGSVNKYPLAMLKAAAGKRHYVLPPATLPV